jgi:hypothetical protein
MKTKYTLLLTLIFTSVLISGCFLQSVHPLITEEQAILMPQLEGTWEDGDNRWTFFRSEAQSPGLDIDQFDDLGDIELDTDSNGRRYITNPNTYLVYIESIDGSENPSLLLGYFGEVGEATYLDLTVVSYGVDPSFENWHTFPVHTFSKIEYVDEQLHISIFDSEWIQELITYNRVRIKHENINGEVLITASNKELRKFVQKFSDEEEAFADPIKLNKVQ